MTTAPRPVTCLTGRVQYDFTVGNNDLDALPLEGLIAVANAVLLREAREALTGCVNPA